VVSTAAAGVRRAKNLVSRLEAWWFDKSRHVETAAPVDITGLTVAGGTDSCFEYVASRAATARLAIGELPIRDHRDYTFVDIGSGKGKILFVAAEYPFRRIEGVEFAAELHRQAQENIRAFHNRRQKCGRIESMHGNAIDYEFPRENLVIYFFNPFGPEVMEPVLENLEASIAAHPREVLLVIAYPELEPVVRRRPRFAQVVSTRRFCIYRTCN
jgi:hypothetical protein